MRHTPFIEDAAPVPADRATARERGFSLIEMILVIVIVGIIATVGAQLMGTGFQLYFTGRDTLNVDAQARLALERMTRELRTVRPATGLTLAPATEVNFTDVDGTAVRYYLNAGDLMRNTQVLAGGVSGLGAVYTDSSGAVTAVPAQVLYISIQFTVTQGGMSSPYRATVSPRN
jgi:prepilin-type N-terminal cleavage/methylation domain-containing protein